MPETPLDGARRMALLPGLLTDPLERESDVYGVRGGTTDSRIRSIAIVLPCDSLESSTHRSLCMDTGESSDPICGSTIFCVRAPSTVGRIQPTGVPGSAGGGSLKVLPAGILADAPRETGREDYRHWRQR